MMSHATHTHYFPHRRVNQVTVCTVAPFVYKRKGSFAVGTILASLSVRTTAGLFRVGGRDLGVLDTSRESLALLFVLVVLVSEAEETIEVTCVRW